MNNNFFDTSKESLLRNLLCTNDHCENKRSSDADEAGIRSNFNTILLSEE